MKQVLPNSPAALQGKSSFLRPCLGLGLLVVVMSLLACTVNPVTGKRNLGLVSTQQEIEIGKENYLPTRQIQGGEYLLDPELSRYVSSVGRSVAAASERQLPYEFVVLNNDIPNAWALPGGKIAINRGLLVELDSEAELAAVLSHEVVHAAARHSAQQMERGMLLQIGVIAAATAASDSDYAGLATGAGLLGAQLINASYSRDAELEADRYGMQYMKKAGYDPSAAVSLQETFVRLSEDRKSNWLTGLFASHPPSEERVRNNRKLAQQLGSGGETGRQRHQQAIAGIKATKPAYAAYEKGRKALRDGNPELAARHANAALGIEPNEAKFHSLLGEAALARNDNDEALKHFNTAVERNPHYFEYRIHRGLLLFERNEPSQARKDFDIANKLLPTAIAHERLGDIARQQGRRADAIRHYEIAAQSDSAVGKRARGKLAEMQH